MRRGYYRRNAKVDANQKEIVHAVSALDGVTVEVIGKPLDLVIGYEGRTYIVEIKNPDGKDKLEPDQETFFKTWTGHAAVARTAADCLRIIGFRYDVPRLLYRREP